MPLYFEDLWVGQQFDTPARTVTDADVAAFAAWTGDYNPVHTDAEFAGASRFGERIAHGVLGLSWCIGLVARTGAFEGTAIALLGVEGWRFRAPILIGDTVRCRVHILDVRATSSGTSGVVQRRFELFNQRAELVQEGRMDVMVARRPAGDAGSVPAGPEGVAADAPDSR